MVYNRFTHLLGSLHYAGELYCVLKETEVRVSVCVGPNCFVGCVVCGMMMKGTEQKKLNSVPAHSLLLLISNKVTAKFNVPIRRTKLYKRYNMPSQHMYCKGLEFNPDLRCTI